MRKNKLFVICLGVLFVGLLAAGFYSFNNIHIESTYIINDQNIIEKNGEHFLLIDERELSLSEEFYEKIELDKYDEYKIKYGYNRLTKNDGEVVMLKRYGEQPWGK